MQTASSRTRHDDQRAVYVSQMSSIGIHSRPVSFSSQIITVSHRSEPYRTTRDPHTTTNSPITYVETTSSVYTGSTARYAPRTLDHFSDSNPVPKVPHGNVVYAGYTSHTTKVDDVPFNLTLIRTVLTAGLLRTVPARRIALGHSTAYYHVRTPVTLNLSRSDDTPSASVCPSSARAYSG